MLHITYPKQVGSYIFLSFRKGHLLTTTIKFHIQRKEKIIIHWSIYFFIEWQSIAVAHISSRLQFSLEKKIVIGSWHIFFTLSHRLPHVMCACVSNTKRCAYAFGVDEITIIKPCRSTLPDLIYQSSMCLLLCPSAAKVYKIQFTFFSCLSSFSIITIV